MHFFHLFFSIFLGFLPLSHEILHINGTSFYDTSSKIDEVKKLKASLLLKDRNNQHLHCLHEIKQIIREERFIVLEDESIWKVSYWDRNDYDHWKSGHLLKVYSNEKFENIDIPGSVNVSLVKSPNIRLEDYIIRNIHATWDNEEARQLVLQNGAIFVTNDKNAHLWKSYEPIFIYHSKEDANEYDLWNLQRNEISRWTLVGDEKNPKSPSILYFEERINRLVVGQKEAVKIIKDAIFNNWTGLSNPNVPIGVFLFLGPSGVGKTELAKVLSKELFKNQNHLIRFDMSHFAEFNSLTRLIGTPPGYINHEEGGQLCESLRAKPRSIVLLDEIEKAHPIVRKVFLPVFDEGYITDSKSRKINCCKVLFIMTSNSCSKEICDLAGRGYSTSEILARIEPMLINELSPELYNRIVPVVFNPLTPELMESLVDLMLEEVIVRLRVLKNIDLTVDESVKRYLVSEGYHPSLGARPLKKLIEQKIIAIVAQAIIYDNIPENAKISISYLENNDWAVRWEKKINKM